MLRKNLLWIEDKSAVGDEDDVFFGIYTYAIYVFLFFEHKFASGMSMRILFYTLYKATMEWTLKPARTTKAFSLL